MGPIGFNGYSGAKGVPGAPGSLGREGRQKTSKLSCWDKITTKKEGDKHIHIFCLDLWVAVWFVPLQALLVYLELEVGKESQEQMVSLGEKGLLAHVQYSVRLEQWVTQDCQETQAVMEIQVSMCATSLVHINQVMIQACTKWEFLHSCEILCIHMTEKGSVRTVSMLMSGYFRK